LGRQIDAAAPEVVLLPGTSDLEHALATMGALAEIESAIDSYSGAGSLAAYGKSLHGKSGKGGAVRDYASPGGQERLVEDFLGGQKGIYGESVAAALAAAGKVPVFITELFARVDAILAAP
jgi:hypothetical protein